MVRADPHIAVLCVLRDHMPANRRALRIECPKRTHGSWPSHCKNDKAIPASSNSQTVKQVAVVHEECGDWVCAGSWHKIEMTEPACGGEGCTVLHT